MNIKPAQVAIIAVPVVAVVGGLFAARAVLNAPIDTPVAVGSVPAPQASSNECSKLLAALPDVLGDFSARALADPAPAATKAWVNPAIDEPIVLRCGIDRPAEFNVASALQDITAADGTVSWLQISGADMGLAASTWYAVDRPVYVAVTIPDGSGSVAVQDVTAAISKTLPRTEMDPGPL